MLGNPADVPSTEFIFRKKQGSQARLHPLGTAKAVLMLEEVLLLESMTTENDLYKSL